MWDLFWLLLIVAVCVGMLLLARRIEPHWSSKDGMAFTCRVQELATTGQPGGRWVESKAAIEAGRVVLARRGFLRPRATSDEIPRTVIGRADGAPARFAVYLLQDDTHLVAMRVPASSPSVNRLDELLP